MVPFLFTVVLAQSVFPLHPQAASTTAADYDKLYFFLTGVTIFFTVAIFGSIFYFMLKYRRTAPDIIPPPPRSSYLLEVIWIVVPAAICVVLFVWGAKLFVRDAEPPRGSMEIFVVGKQWMWQLQHQEGQREINALHVPVGVPVKLTMTSQDVIHDFSVPAFRIKQDVLPGRYTSEWFQATTTGTYHLFCDQYCGMLHSGMIGWVYVMEPREYARWLRDNATGESMVQAGERLFTQFNCVTCHVANGSGSGPSLQGAFGNNVTLRDGQTRLADDNFLRQAIVNPTSISLPNYSQIMPAFQGELNEQQILQLIAYIKSLSSASPGQDGQSASQTSGQDSGLTSGRPSSQNSSQNSRRNGNP